MVHRRELHGIASMLTAELNRTRKIGAEFEMTVPLVGRGTGADVQMMLANILSANGIRAISRGYDHTILPPTVDVAVEYDGSVQGESRYNGVTWLPIEVKTRILNGVDDWERIVPRMLDICRYMGGRINASTGFHLHLGFEEVTSQPRAVRSLWNLMHRFEQVVFGLVSPSRRANRFCRALPPTSKVLHGANDLPSLKSVLGQYDRYTGLNLTHVFGEQPHIEFRHHQGTLDPDKARHWLRFCLQLLQHAVTRNCQAAPMPLPNDRKSLDKLLVTTGLKVNTRVYGKVSPELRETGRYLLRRWKHFNAAGSPGESVGRGTASEGDSDAEAN